MQLRLDDRKKTQDEVDGTRLGAGCKLDGGRCGLATLIRGSRNDWRRLIPQG